MAKSEAEELSEYIESLRTIIAIAKASLRNKNHAFYMELKGVVERSEEKLEEALKKQKELEG